MSEEFIVICSYCNRCYGEYINEEKIYFPPIEIITDPTAIISHGICPTCYAEIEEYGELY